MAHPTHMTMTSARSPLVLASISGNRLKKLDFNTTTLGEVTFRRVDLLRDPFQVADARLQTRLDRFVKHCGRNIKKY